jgi:hypothetical protein
MLCMVPKFCSTELNIVHEYENIMMQLLCDSLETKPEIYAQLEILKCQPFHILLYQEDVMVAKCTSFGSIYVGMHCTKAYTSITLLKELLATHSTFFLEVIIKIMRFSYNNKQNSFQGPLNLFTHSASK